MDANISSQLQHVFMGILTAPPKDILAITALSQAPHQGKYQRLLETSKAPFQVVLAAQLICWTGQFIGHGVFEKRAPALLDNLSQALIMAPFFVLLEALQMLFGYEPYPGFHARVKTRVEADIKEWQEKQQKKIS